jgi:hypothetical protein
MVRLMYSQILIQLINPQRINNSCGRINAKKLSSSSPSTHRLTILVLPTLIWTTLFVICLLIMIVFFKTLLSTWLFATVQTIVILFVLLSFVPLPLFNALTLFYWTICTIRKKIANKKLQIHLVLTEMFWYMLQMTR